MTEDIGDLREKYERVKERERKNKERYLYLLYIFLEKLEITLET